MVWAWAGIDSLHLHNHHHHLRVPPGCRSAWIGLAAVGAILHLRHLRLLGRAGSGGKVAG